MIDYQSFSFAENESKQGCFIHFMRINMRGKKQSLKMSSGRKWTNCFDGGKFRLAVNKPCGIVLIDLSPVSRGAWVITPGGQ